MRNIKSYKNKFDWLGSSVGTSERLKIVRSPVRSRPKPQKFKIFLKGRMLQRVSSFLFRFGSMHRWALVGTVTFFIDYMFFLIIYSANNSVYIANFCSGLISIAFNYFANYIWSFKSYSNHSRTVLKYLINLTLFWTLGTILLKSLITIGLEAKYAKLIPIPIIAPLSFLSLKFFVFRK